MSGILVHYVMGINMRSSARDVVMSGRCKGDRALRVFSIAEPELTEEQRERAKLLGNLLGCNQELA